MTPELRRKTEFAFEDGERQRWHYIPREMFDRKGVYIQEMNQKQRDAAFNLLATGLSPTGYQKATAIIDLEATLGEQERMEGMAQLARDPELYAFSGFWRSDKPRSLGVAGGGTPCLTPFYRCEQGVDYAESVLLWILIPQRFGMVPTRDCGYCPPKKISPDNFWISQSGSEKQNGYQRNSTADILTRDVPKVQLDTAEGLAVESMTTGQREVLAHLIDTYIDRLPEQLAKIEGQKLRDAGINDIHFAWAGPANRGQPHYYRLHGPFFFAEYDNTQNNANHIHTVWRHIEDDFGIDLLRSHYQNGHDHA